MLVKIMCTENNTSNLVRMDHDGYESLKSFVLMLPKAYKIYVCIYKSEDKQ